MKLIITADDYGLEHHIDSAIVEASRAKYLSSVACFANMPYDDLKFKIAKLVEAKTDVGVGLHLNLTAGKPLSTMPSLSKNGRFIGSNQMRLSSLNLAEIETELRLQIANMLSVLLSLGPKLKIDSLSSHMNILCLNNDLYAILLKLSVEFNIPLRSSKVLSDVVKMPFKFDWPLAKAGFWAFNWRSLFSMLRYFTKRTRHMQTERSISINPSVPDFSIPNVYGNTNLEAAKDILQFVANANPSKCELIFHLSNGSFSGNTTNGIDADYFEQRVEEFQLLRSQEFQAALKNIFINLELEKFRQL